MDTDTNRALNLVAAVEREMDQLKQRIAEYEKQWAEREFSIDRLESRVRGLEEQLSSYNLKIQEWWSAFSAYNPSSLTLKNIATDMESFMREHQIKLEKPQ